VARKSKSKGFMKILVSERGKNTLQDIQAAVAAADKTQGKPEGASKTLARVTIADMKAGIARAVQSKHGRR
jgi:hypothetical protein